MQAIEGNGAFHSATDTSLIFSSGTTGVGLHIP